jgi:hypothetical protein
MARQTQRVVVRFSSGAEYGLPDAETAKRIYPNAEIVRYTDGRPYEPKTGDEDAGSGQTGGADAAQAGTGPDLDTLSREQLDAFAPSVGVDPADYSRKGDLLKAIRAALREREGQA